MLGNVEVRSPAVWPKLTPSPEANPCPNQKIRKRYLAAPLDSENLQDLVRAELKSGSHVATEGLVWLVR